MDIKLEYRKKSIRSYVVRAGRMTAAQRQAFDSGWPRYGLKLSDGALDVAGQFGTRAPLVVEIGFGMGESLLQMAQAAPDHHFVGIEVHPPGVGSLMNAAAAAEVDNLRLYLADATDVMRECIGAQTVDRLQLYFPDPWHKKKHNKRRIVQPEFVQLIRSRLRLGGVFHMATDWQPYAEQMLATMQQAAGFSNCTGAEYAQKPDYRPLTKFERRGARLGHGVWDLLFERCS